MDFRNSRSGLVSRVLLPKLVLSCCFFVAFHAESSNGSLVLQREKRGNHDQSVRFYINDRTCYWNEPCKEEFQSQFRCRCQGYSYCRGPGKYYNAYCDMNRTGYIWMQPETSRDESWGWKDKLSHKSTNRKGKSKAKQFKIKPTLHALKGSKN